MKRNEKEAVPAIICTSQHVSDLCSSYYKLPQAHLYLPVLLVKKGYALLFIRESVDSLCRDGADVQYMQKPYNFTTNTLKTYLSV